MFRQTIGIIQMKIIQYSNRSLIVLLAVLAFSASCRTSEQASAPANPCSEVSAQFEASFEPLSRLVAAETYRAEQFANEEAFTANMQTIVDDLQEQAREFNRGQKKHTIEPWEWKVESGTSQAP